MRRPTAATACPPCCVGRNMTSTISSATTRRATRSYNIRIRVRRYRMSPSSAASSECFDCCRSVRWRAAQAFVEAVVSAEERAAGKHGRDERRGEGDDRHERDDGRDPARHGEDERQDRDGSRGPAPSRVRVAHGVTSGSPASARRRAPRRPPSQCARRRRRPGPSDTRCTAYSACPASPECAATRRSTRSPSAAPP